MKPLTLLTLLPVWAVAFAVALSALRLLRKLPRGVVALAAGLGIWITALIVLCTDRTQWLAPQVLPLGMLLAAAYTHAGTAIGIPLQRRYLTALYTYGIGVAALGLFAPEWLLASAQDRAGFRPGPAFVPIAVLSTWLTAMCAAWIGNAAFSARNAASTHRASARALLLSQLGASTGGGFAILVRLISGVPVEWTALPLAVATYGSIRVLLLVVPAADARLLRYSARGTLLTACASAAGLTALYAILPALAPSPSFGWYAVVIFIVAIPLEPLRQWAIELSQRLLRGESFALADVVHDKELLQSRAQQAEKLAELGIVASRVAHEVRNPMGVILAQLKLLEREDANAARLQEIRAQVARTSRFLQELLDHAKPVAHQPTRNSVRALLELAETRARAMFEKAPPAITIDVPEGLMLDVDAESFANLWVILMQNACIAVTSSSSAPTADPAPEKKIRVYSTDQKAVIELCIEDNGPGVPPALVPQLFALFATGRGRDAQFPGTGLGLATARRIAEAHAATLTYAPTEHGGARFVLAWQAR
jgi:signal transduction histidine kinase